MATINQVQRVVRTECSALPRGWIREECPRMSHQIGSGGTRPDIFYISPMGKKVKSKSELARVLGEQYDLTAFDYTSGKLNPLLLKQRFPVSQNDGNKRKSTPNGHRSNKAQPNDVLKSVKTDTTLIPPIRQTASIFKQPVTIFRSQSTGSKVKTDKHCTTEKPKQLFWEKRLSGMRPSYPHGDYEAFQLPENFKPVGPGITNECALASISTALHNANGPIIGQTNRKGSDDLFIFVNPNQPLIRATHISQADIDKQESRVRDMRMKLARAIAAIRT